MRAEPVDNAPARSGCVPDVVRAGSVAFHPDGIGGRSWACPGRFPASCPLEMTRPLQGFYVLSSETIREIPYFGLDRVGLTVSIRLLFRPSIEVLAPDGVGRESSQPCYLNLPVLVRGR